MPHAMPLLQPVPGMPAAIYLRVSTPKQKEQGYSLDTQLPACLAYAQQYAFPVQDDHIFVDDESGTTPDRPGMQDLRDLVHQQAIKLVIVYKLDRLMRDYTYQLMMMKEFSRYGVQVLDTTAPPQAPTLERTLLQHILGAMAEFELGQILERTERGRRGRAAAGIPPARSPYGYHYVGSKREGHYILDPYEAPIVLSMFTWYAREGLTLQQVTARLNREQIHTSCVRRGIRYPTSVPGGVWHPATVLRILRNTAYLGTVYYGKTTGLPGNNPRRKKTRHQATDEETWTPIVVPPLVPPDLFAAAQQQRLENAMNSPRNRKREYLLQAGRLRCDVCGHVMSGVGKRTQRYYRCYQRYDGLQYRTCRRVRADKVEGWVWEAVCHLARHPETLYTLMAEYRQEVGPARIAENRSTLTQHLRKTQRALDLLMDLYLHPEDDAAPLSKAQYLTKKKALTADVALYQTQLKSLTQQEQALAALTSQQADMATLLTTVAAILDDATTLEAQRRILDMLALKAFYTPEGHVRLQVQIKQQVHGGLEGAIGLRSCYHTQSNSPLVLTWALAC